MFLHDSGRWTTDVEMVQVGRCLLYICKRVRYIRAAVFATGSVFGRGWVNEGCVKNGSILERRLYLCPFRKKKWRLLCVQQRLFFC